MRFVIQTHDLTKRFPKPGRLAGLPLPFARAEGTLAVDRVSVGVEQGEIFGLIGPNGAGKTTLVKMLSTLIIPTSGTARVNGYDLSQEMQIKASIGLVTGGERSFYPRLACRENLRFYASLYNLSSYQTERRIAELSRLLGLGGFLDKRYDACSTGMKHQLALARGLINDPQLLFLDEPTRSLDPLAAAKFREAVYALAHQVGHTVFLITHDMDEAVELCDRVGVMLLGRLRVAGAPRDLRQLIEPQERCRIEIQGFTPRMADRLRGLDGVLSLVERGGGAGGVCVELQMQDRKRVLPTVVRAIGESGGAIDGLEFETASWEEAFERLPDAEDGRATGRREEAPMASAAVGTADRRSPGSAEDAGLPGTYLFSEGLGEGGEQESAVGRSGFLRVFYKPLLFLRRDLKTQMSYRLSFVLQFLGILFSSATFYFVARLLGAGAVPYLDGYGGDYFSFVLVGIAFVGYQGVALHSFSSLVQSAQTTGTLEAMLVTPTRLPTILFSSSLWDFLFTSVRSIVYLLAGVIVLGADLRHANPLAAFVILCLTVLTLSGIGILAACFIMVFKRGNPVNFLFTSFSILLSGVYYPVAVLPSWLRAVAYLFPLTYSLEAMRRALLAGESLADLGWEVAVLAVFSVVLLPLGLVAFRYAVRQAKRDGSLTQF